MGAIAAPRLVGYSRWAWILQAASGMLLVALLGVHITAQHFMGHSGVLSYQEVVAYLRTPLAFFLETTFSASVLFHALAGVRAILFDLGLTARTEQRISLVLTVLGVALFTWTFALTLSLILR